MQTAFELVREMVTSAVFKEDHTLNSFKAFSNESIESLIQNPMEECLAEAASGLTETATLFNSYQQVLSPSIRLRNLSTSSKEKT